MVRQNSRPGSELLLFVGTGRAGWSKKLQFEYEIRFRWIGSQFEGPSGLQSRRKLAVNTIGIAAEGF